MSAFKVLTATDDIQISPVHCPLLPTNPTSTTALVGGVSAGWLWWVVAVDGLALMGVGGSRVVEGC